MFKLFYPFEYVENVFNINYEALYNLGYRGIIFDIDNTLVHHGDDSNKKVDELFRKIHSIGFKTLLLTNNDRERVERFVKNIDTTYICEACKPDTANFFKAIDMLRLSKEEIVVIGDQIFTDILGANKSGLASILVKFIRLKTETKIGKRRHIENIILNFYSKSKRYTHRIGNVCGKREI